MPVIHPQTYAKFKPIFLDALKTRTEPGASRTEMMHAIIHQLKDASYTRDDAEDNLSNCATRVQLQMKVRKAHESSILFKRSESSLCPASR